jgi:hypothetical protein
MSRQNLFLVFLWVFFFKIAFTLLSTQPTFTYHDQAQAVQAAKSINLFHQFPLTPQYCGGCDTLTFLKNSYFYYLILSLWYYPYQYESLIIICALWISLSIIFIYLLIQELTHHPPTSFFITFLFGLSPIFQEATSIMPYQPIFLLTLTPLIVWLLLYNRHHQKYEINILSGVVLLLAIQFHFSAIMIIPIYCFLTYKNFRNFSLQHQFFLIMFHFILIAAFIYLNFNFSFSLLPHYSLQLIKVFSISYQFISQDLKLIFPFHLNPVVFILLSIISVKLNKQLLILLPLLALIPLVGIFPNYNYYTVIFWPFLLIVLSGIIRPLLKSNFIFFISISALFYLFINTISLFSQPVSSASANNFENIHHISREINRFSDPSRPNLIYQYDGYLNTFIGYYLVQNLSYSEIKQLEIKGSSEYYQTLDNSTYNKLVYCQHHCSNFESEFTKYQPQLLPSSLIIYRIQ